MEANKTPWFTALAVLLALFLLFLAFVIMFQDNAEVSGAERAFGVIADLVFGFAILGGLWALRGGRLSQSLALGAIGFGLVGGLLWFWMIVPPIVALIVLWFGVVRGGLVRELTTR